MDSCKMILMLCLLALTLGLGAGCVATGPLSEGGGGAENNSSGDTVNNSPGDSGNNSPGDSGNNSPGDPLLPPQCEPSEEICDGLDNDCDQEVDEDRACACTVDPSCYGGPPQTRGVGACTDGARECDGEFFGPCAGWTGPVEEICADGVDNDCDGDTDEGACVEVCQPGDSRLCYDGPPENAGVGICAQGMQVCSVERRWGDCEGSVLPQQEFCDDGVDNDCDGEIDTDCFDDIPREEERFVVSEQTERLPVDFIMAVDNSGSMRDTVAQVEGNLGDFARRMVDSGIDYRFVLVAQRGTDRSDPDVCIPPPMAGPACSNSGRFRHLNQTVGSHSAYDNILDCYDGCGRNNERFSDFIRAESLKQVIVVTDDESERSWPSFRDNLRGQIGEFILNGVVGLRSGGCVANVGDRYVEGASETGGELLHICDQDWGEVINVLFESTLSRLDSTFTLDGTPVPDSIKVFTRVGGGAQQEEIGTWIYNAEANAVTFTDSTSLSPGVEVIITYVLL